MTSAGVLGGTPNVGGTFNFTVQATDSTAAGVQTATASFSIVVDPLLTISTTSPLVPGAAARPYTAPLATNGGTAPFQWTGSNLPAWLSLASQTGILSGTPPSSGNYNLAIQVRDSLGQTAGAALALSIGGSLTIQTNVLPGGVVNAAYSQGVFAAGGLAPYAFSLAGGALPGGLALSSAGTLTGTPTASGSFTFTVQATDSTVPTAQIATQQFTLQILPGLAITTACAAERAGGPAVRRSPCKRPVD